MDSSRGLWRQTNKLMPVLAGVAFVLFLAVTAIFVLCNGTLALPEGETCAQCVREWVGAMSGWFAGLVGAIAVLMAYLTVETIRQQIYAASEDSLRIANETKKVINEKLYDILKELNLAWQYLDCHDDPGVSFENQKKARNMARPSIFWAIKDRDLADLEDGLSSLLPIDRTRFRVVLSTLRELRHVAAIEKSGTDDLFWNIEKEGMSSGDRAVNLGIHLSHLAKNIEKYDKELYFIFDGRRKYNVNHDPYWKHAEDVVHKRIAEWKNGLEK